ncbi:MAG: hypothetical protein HS114_34665 [Anaerolineales bacterium]|nr:hypothetical protein [Anaerolineales bacterium]
MPMYKTPINFQGRLYSVYRTIFDASGQLALALVEDSGNLFHVASCQHRQLDLDVDETVLNDYAETDDMMWLLTLAGIVEFLGKRAPGTDYPICRLVAELPTIEPINLQ